VRLDALDIRIVRLLHEDARLSFREIAEKVGSTNPTVSARVKALEDIGLLRSYRAQVDHAVLGTQSYVVSIRTHPPSVETAFMEVRSLRGATSLFLLPGGQIVAHFHLRPPAHTLAQLHRDLARLPGLISYDATEVLESQEGSPLEDIPENVEVPCHQCRGPIHGDPVKGRFGERVHVFCCRHCLGTFRERFEQLERAATETRRGATTGGVTLGRGLKGDRAKVRNRR